MLVVDGVGFRRSLENCWHGVNFVLDMVVDSGWYVEKAGVQSFISRSTGLEMDRKYKVCVLLVFNKQPRLKWMCIQAAASGRLVGAMHVTRCTELTAKLLSCRHLQTMATRKVADSTLYHLSPRGFWKKFSTFLVS